MIYDFDLKSDISQWKTTNDDVMGGISSSSITLNTYGHGVFSGTVSTKNNGGFAMIRLALSANLKSSNNTIKLRVKGDNKKYQLRLKSSNLQRYWYIQSFETKDDWQEIELSLDEFYPSFRGYRLNQPNFKSDVIKEIAFLIGNKKDETFKLEIDYILIN